FKDNFDRTVNWWEQKLYEFFHADWGETVKGWADGLSNALVSAIAGLGDKIYDAVRAALPPAFQEGLDHIWGHSIVEDWLSSLGSGLPSALSDIAGKSADAFGSLADGISSRLGDASSLV